MPAMSRLKRFDEHRFVGTRDTMVVYDCDNQEEFAELEARVEADRLFDLNLLQSFAPDVLPEARNRGFTPRL
jgi:hypothetical protein